MSNFHAAKRLMAQSIAFPQPLPGAARGRHPRRGAGHHPGAALRHRAQLRGQAGGHHARAATTAAGVVLADPLRRALSNAVFKRGQHSEHPAGSWRDAHSGKLALSCATRSQQQHVEHDNCLQKVGRSACGVASSDEPAVQGSNVFAGKHGFITPRDLFRWAGRGAVGYQQVCLGFGVLI